MTRTDLLNHLAEKHKLTSYLEIGVQDPAQNFDKIICNDKISVDPDPNAHATFCMTSDDFFSINSPTDKIDVTTINHFYSTGGQREYLTIDRRRDLIFIDGLHTAEQVKKDFENALRFLSPNGFIVLHDCNPQKEEHTIVPRPKATGHWNGDVYRFAILLTSKYVTNDRAVTVDIDNGMVVFSAVQPYYGADLSVNIEWSDFDANRKELLNLISWEDFIRMQ